VKARLAFAGLLAPAFFSGCLSGSALRARGQGLGDQIQAIEKPAYNCAERELAMAKAHLTFAYLELDQGNYFRAGDHLDTAVDFYRQAAANSQAPGCLTGPDRDGDGVPDASDACPDVPEDRDGFEDQDGCPEDQDTDKDGIPDSRDRCPNDPEDMNGVEDDDGCPELNRDKDGDGIPDATDKCPDQPEDKDAFQDEDGCPDPDNDQDGVLDAQDRCPLQPEDKDGFQDEDGCPDPDNDQDRIADAQDKCPNEPEDYDGDADDDGCPDVYRTIIVRDDRIELKQTVHFQTAKDRILPDSFAMLNEVAQALKDSPNVNVRIEGHTDSVGDNHTNQVLSEKRAQSVRAYLIKQGIAAERLEAVGYGEDRPIEDNRTEEGRAANRRVEFHLIRK
jgi:outer membrane protein OmpA-like peptidoglycan-associated protein